MIRTVTQSELNGLTRLTFDLSGDFIVSQNITSQINTLSNLLPLELYEKPGGYLLIYDAGSMVSLSKYLRQNKIGKDTTIKILKGICAPLLSCKEKGLYPENFSFDIDHIFWDAISSELRLIYFPFETGVQAIPALRSLLSKIFGELLIPSVSHETAYINQIMDCYKQSSFSIKALAELLEKLEMEKSKGKKKKDNKTKKDFWSKLFKKEKKVASIPVAGEKKEPAFIPVNDLKRSNGTELLIPQDRMDFLAANAIITLQLSITTMGLSKEIEIHNFPCALGRVHSDADIVLEDKSVSRKHALLEFSEGVITIVDTNSSNGVIVGDSKLLPGIPQLIQIGDLIKIGRSEIHVISITGI